MSPSELLGVLKATRPVNIPVFGPHVVYPESVTRHLGTLTRGGLVEPGPLIGRRREYAVTGLGCELLDSLADATAYGRSRYHWLVRYSRAQQHLNPAHTGTYAYPGDSQEMAEERLRRRSTALLFGTLFGPKWTFAIMAALTWGSLRFSQIIAVVNRAAEASPDVVSGRLADSVLTTRLDALQQLGLVARVPAQEGRRALYTLTDEGRALMVALEPVARFGIQHDAEMAAAVRAM